MPFNDFRNDPKGYCSTHQVYLANSDTAAGTMLPGGAVAIPTGNHGIAFAPPPPAASRIELVRDMLAQPLPTRGQKVKMALGIGSRVRRDYRVQALAVGAADNGFRYLPFRQNHVTYMSLDAGASFAITGPLTGCTVSVGRDAANTLWFFHANENGQHGAAARASQQAMTVWAAGQVGVPIPNLRWCVMTVDYQGMAFVFGRIRPGGGWKFYVHDNDLGAAGAVVTQTNKFADI